MKLPKLDAFDVICTVGKVCMVAGTIINFATGKKAEEKALDKAVEKFFKNKK